jgi:hypothetical protein
MSNEAYDIENENAVIYFGLEKLKLNLKVNLFSYQHCNGQAMKEL